MKAPCGGDEDALIDGLLHVEEKLREPVRAKEFIAARALERHSEAVMLSY
jgi:hypothetical protein